MAKKPVKQALRSRKWSRVWPFYNNRAMSQSPVEKMAKKKALERKVSKALDKIIDDLESDQEPKQPKQ